MSYPIRRIDYDSNECLDIFSLFNNTNNKILNVFGENKKKNTELLYKIWSKTPDDNIVVEVGDIYIIVDNKNSHNNDIIELKTAGYVNGGSGKIKLTSQGKKALLDIILAQDNKYKR